jgi:ABC-type Fe3+/spermidine/putrescine transport system ATPase subunit
MSYFAFGVVNPEEVCKQHGVGNTPILVACGHCHEELKQKVQDLDYMCKDKNKTIANLVEEVNFLKKTISDANAAKSDKPSKIEQQRKDKLVQMIDPNYFKILGIKHI